VSFEHKLVDLSNKPPAFLNKYAEAIGNTHTNAKVPLLEHGDDLMVESELVAKYVAQHVGKEGLDSMYPVNDADTSQRIDKFLDAWHPVVDRYYNYLSASSESSAQSSRIAFCETLQILENELPGEGGDFCRGDTFSIAECVAAPWVQRFFVTLPYFRGVDFGEKVLPVDCVKVARWMDAVRQRPSVIASACPDEEMIAAARRYYVSFVSAGAPGIL
jgi:glutathione S-transferase